MVITINILGNLKIYLEIFWEILKTYLFRKRFFK